MPTIVGLHIQKVRRIFYKNISRKMNEEGGQSNSVSILINEYRVECIKDTLIKLSPMADLYFQENPNSKEIKINISQSNTQIDLFKSFLQDQKIHLNSSNDLFFIELAKKLQIQSLEDISENWELYELQEAEEKIFNIDETSEQFENFKEISEIIGNETLCRIIINACIARSNFIQIYLNLIHDLNIELIFSRILLNQMKILHEINSVREEKIQTLCFLARYLHDRGFIQKNKIPDIFQDMPPFFADLSNHPSFSTEEDKQEYKKNVMRGINPNSIALILRIDDIESFQKVACLPTFDINQKIKQSEFERCDFINNRSCSLLEFCAFFSSINCFKYIFLDENSIKNSQLMKFAIAGGNTEIIHICEQFGFFNFKDTCEIAIKFHHWDIFEWLIEHKFPSEKLYDLQIDDFFSYVNQCIRFSNFTTLVYLLLSKEADLNFALLTAIDNDNLLLVKWLIKHKEKLNEKDISKQKIGFFQHAIKNENIEMLKLLLNQKEFNNINVKYKGKPAIFTAIETENFDVYKFLIEQKQIDFNIRDFGGKQLIHIACEHENTDILYDLLINHNDEIDINSLDKTNNTPLHLACENGNIGIIDTMLRFCRQKIELNLKNKKGKTPLMMGCLSNRRKKRLDVIQHIYDYVNNDDEKFKLINEKGSLNKSLLHMACENKEIKIVEYLISLPVIDVNSLDNDNRTPLMISVFYGFDDIIKILLNHPDIDINIHDINNKTAYDIAISYTLSSELIEAFQSKMSQ